MGGKFCPPPLGGLGEQEPASRPPKERAVELPQRGPTGPVCFWFYGSAILLHEQPLNPEADVLLMGQTKAMLERVLLVSTEQIAQAAMPEVLLMAPTGTWVGQQSRQPTKTWTIVGFLLCNQTCCGSSPRSDGLNIDAPPEPQLRLVSKDEALE